MMVNLTPILEATVSLMSLIITGFLIPWLRNHISTQKFSELQKWVKIAVYAAEQSLTSGTTKKAYVQNFLKSKGFTLDTDSLDAMIEATVHELPEAPP